MYIERYTDDDAEGILRQDGRAYKRDETGVYHT